MVMLVYVVVVVVDYMLVIVDYVLCICCMLVDCLYACHLCWSASPPASGPPGLPPSPSSRRRENMVGVNMVLAEFIKFKHALYKSYGI